MSSASCKKDFLPARPLNSNCRRSKCVPISASLKSGYKRRDRSKHMPLVSAGPRLAPSHLESVPLREQDPCKVSIPGANRDVSSRRYVSSVSAGRIAERPAFARRSCRRASPRDEKPLSAHVTYDGDLPQASSSMSVTLQLTRRSTSSPRRTCWGVAARSARISRKFPCPPSSGLHATALEFGRTFS